METAYFTTPCGIMEGVFFDGALLKLSFTDFRGQQGNPVSAAIRETDFWLKSYFQGQCAPTPPVHLEGTDFQQKVWSLLMEVPFGKTISYSALKNLYLQKTGKERLCTRAVAHAVAKNPILLLIPCHRVIRSNGEPGEYGGGAEKKKFLLDMEHSFLGKIL